MKLNPYLIFDGQCEAAFRYYQQHLGGTIEAMLKFADAPPAGEDQPGCGPVSPEVADRIMHASLLLDGDRRLMASDSPAGQHKPMAGFGLALTYPSAQEARKVFEALSAGGSVTMPMGKTFWAEAFGMCTDRFGTPWMVGGGQQAG